MPPLGVPLDEAGAVYQRRQVRAVRDVEEDRADPRQEAHHVQLSEAQDPQRIGQRHAADHHQPKDVGGDQYPAPAEPVDPHADGEPKQHEGEELHRGERPHLESEGLEHQDRGEGKGQEGDLRSEQADRLPAPPPHEVPVPPQTASRRLGLERRSQVTGDKGARHARHIVVGCRVRIRVLPWRLGTRSVRGATSVNTPTGRSRRQIWTGFSRPGAERHRR